MKRESIRKVEGIVALTLSTLAAFVGLFWLVFILGDVLVHGIRALTPDLFLQDPVPAGVKGGGLRNAFVGQLLITLFATLMGVPVGVLGGTFLAEYAHGNRIARMVSILSDIMVSVPSIVIGTFIYAILVKP
ncbi:MAG: pstA, partial [Deltaproteobacteria bacterium]|nr:pstA [Deltaproteobacteria bacterium]